MEDLKKVIVENGIEYHFEGGWLLLSCYRFGEGDGFQYWKVWNDVWGIHNRTSS